MLHFFAVLTWLSIMPAMILARTGNNELDLASVQSAMGIGDVLGGILADRVMEPAMASGGSAASVFGWLVGAGPAAGMALMYIGSAVLAILVCLLAYLFPAVRHVEDIERDFLASTRPRQPAPFYDTRN